MVALVSVETVLLVLLIVLVAALLRSHAELLRRLGPEGSDAPRVPQPLRAQIEDADEHRHEMVFEHVGDEHVVEPREHVAGAAGDLEEGPEG